MRKIKFSLFFYFLFIGFLHSQSKIDSLKALLPGATPDTNKVAILIDLGKAFFNSGDYDQSLKYSHEAQVLSEQLGFEKGVSTALVNTGFVFFGRGEYEKALDKCFEALEMRKKMNDEQGIAKVENTIGAIYTNQGNYQEALAHGLKALKIIEKTNDTKTIASCYGNIGNIYLVKRSPEKALEYYMRSYELFLKTNQKGDICKALNAIGNGYGAMDNYVKALEYYMRSLKINEEIGNKVGIATSHSNIGLTNSNLKNYKEAIFHLNKALALHEQLGNKLGMSITLHTIAEIFIKEKKYAEALDVAKRSLDLAAEIGSQDKVKEAEQVLSEAYEAQGDHINALFHYKKYVDARDSILNETTSKQIAELQIQYETEKKENENKTLLHENQIQGIEISKNRIYMFSLAGLLILVLSFAFLIIRQNKLKAQQRALIIEQKLLRSQMNPHFIFNSLTAIESYIYKHEPKEAGKYLSGFARLMRLILENSREEYIPLSKEIKTLEYYLQLQKNRFEDAFEYRIELSEDTDPDAIAIPPMLAQPFIENSIEHGLKNIERQGEISIHFSLKADCLLFEVKDNGIGLEASMAKNVKNKNHHSMAITITTERLAIMNRGKRNKIRLNIEELKDTSSAVFGTKVSFEIPFKEI